MKIIAFVGNAGSGKDTACHYLRDNYGYQHTSLAEPLKQMAKIAFGFSDEQLYGPSAKREEPLDIPFSGDCVRCGSRCRVAFIDKAGGTSRLVCTHKECSAEYPQFINARIALQTLGTEWGRRLYEDVWVDALLRRIEAGPPDGAWCVSDARFRNELRAISRKGGFLVRIVRGPATTRSTHASETELQSIPKNWFHCTIYNHGTIEQLHEQLEDMMQDFAAAEEGA